VTEIDVARLADWMDFAALPGKGEPLTARFLSGGTQNVIYEIRRGEERCVIRMPPPGAPPDRDKGILREWRIIEALDGTRHTPTRPRSPCARMPPCWGGRST
jgi:aminoglycoside phosphotransferase (APT) family kinase protein